MDSKKLVIIPSDPLNSNVDVGERNYNPLGYFDEVYALSPLEKGEREAFGMKVIGVNEKSYLGLLKDIQPDVVRAYGGYWPADFACFNRFPDIPVIVSVHDTKNIHKSVKFADIIICMSKIIANIITSRSVNPDKIRIMPNRIDSDIFKPINAIEEFEKISSQFPEGKHILHVGRKCKQKNLETMINALKHLPDDYYCIFIGRGDTDPYTKLAKSLGVENRCFWIKSVKNEELPFWYSWCDCMCTPSRWEGFGIVFIEAAACGTPIITSDIAPMNEYLIDNESACLVSDYENPQEIASAIKRVCEDNEYRHTISNGAILTSQKFDRKLIDQQEINIYEEAMRMVSLTNIDGLNFKTCKIKYQTGKIFYKYCSKLKKL